MHRVTLNNSLRTVNRLSRLTGLSKSLEHGRFGVLVSSNQSSASTLNLFQNRALTSITPPSASAVAARVAQEPFLNGSSSTYVEEMYNSWLEDPKSVHKSWDIFFRNATNNATPGTAHQKPPTMFPFASNAMTTAGGSMAAAAAAPGFAGNAMSFTRPNEMTSHSQHQDINDHLSVQAIIRSYQVSLFLNILYFYRISC